MRVLAVVHQKDAASGVFADAVAARGDELDEWLIPLGTRPPAPVDAYGAVVVLGGAMHVDQDDRYRWLREERVLLERLVSDGVPVLGVCLGAQLLAQALGAPVRRMPSAEVGWFDVGLTPEAVGDPVFAGLPGRFRAFEWHAYRFELPAGATALARNDRCLQAFRAGEAAWGVQFHAEVRGADVEEWIRTSKPEDDGVVDFERLLVETADRIAGWNAFGRELCARFLDAAERATRASATTRATSRRS